MRVALKYFLSEKLALSLHPLFIMSAVSENAVRPAFYDTSRYLPIIETLRIHIRQQKSPLNCKEN